MTVRILGQEELPQRGDLLFCAGDSFVSLAIRLGQLDGLSHAGVVTAVEGEHIVLLEALSAGVVQNRRRIDGLAGYVVRPGDPLLSNQVAAAAERRAALGVSYSWSTIVWQAGRMLRSSATKWLGFTILVGGFLQWAAEKPASHPSSMICSEFALASLKGGIDAVASYETPSASALHARIETLLSEELYKTSPIDLFRALAGRRNG